MKTRYAIEPTYKKSVIEYNTFTKKVGDETYVATMETGWRWGKFYISVDAEEIKEIVESSEVEISAYDDFELDYCDDGCWGYWTFSDNVPEEEQEKVQEIWEEGGWGDLEENDWYDDGCEYYMNCDISFTKVEDDS